MPVNFSSAIYQQHTQTHAHTYAHTHFLTTTVICQVQRPPPHTQAVIPPTPTALPTGPALSPTPGCDSPSTVSQRATAPYTSSRIRMTTRLMMAAVVLTVRRTWLRVMGFELMCSAALVEIRYRITPNTMANVTPIW